MAEHHDENYERSVKDAAERIVEQRIHHARKEEVVVMYEDLLQTIWERLLPTLGRMTVCAIMERSLAMTVERHPFMEQLNVTRDGVDFEVMRERLRDQQHDEVRAAMKEFVANLIDLLAMLTGDIIVRRLLTEIGGERIG
jgi:hypothetical protein